MSQDEKEAFLADLHVGVLAIPRKEGEAPLTAPLWYDYQPGGDAWFIIGRDSLKAQLIKVGASVSLCAQNEGLPYKYVSAECEVTALEPAGENLEAMAVRYLGDEMGKAYAAGSSLDAQVTVRVRPKRWLAVDYGKLGG